LLFKEGSGDARQSSRRGVRRNSFVLSRLNIRNYSHHAHRRAEPDGAPPCTLGYNALVPEPQKKPPAITPVISALRQTPAAADDRMTCERCGADMYRMHAVWRCPNCRFKTDCCGW
jgi:hypothetical protein